MSEILIIFILLLGLLALRGQKRRQPLEDKSRADVARPPWAITCFLGLLAIVPLLVYLTFNVFGRSGSFIGYFGFLALCSIFGIRLQRAMKRTRAWRGAFIGGAVGANVLLATTLVWSYVRPEPFEDEGLGFFGSLTAFSPYVTILGLGVGGFVLIFGWLIRQWIEGEKRIHRPAANGQTVEPD